MVFQESPLLRDVTEIKEPTKSVAETISDHVLSRVQVNNPFRNNPDPDKAYLAENYLKKLNLWERYQQATTLRGKAAYEDRYVSGLASTVFSVVGLHPIKVEEKKRRYKDFLDFLIYSGFLPQIEEAWQKKKEKYGILTPPRPPFDMEFTDWVETYCKPNFRYVDVYSAPQRYPEIVDYINSKPVVKTVVEFGCGPGDFLLDVAGPLVHPIGIERLSLGQAVHDEMMYRNRWMIDGTEKWIDIHEARVKAEEHIKAIMRSHITIIKGDVLKQNTIRKVDSLTDKLHLFAVSLNVMYPHYDVRHIQQLIRNMMQIDPEYIILGGGDPSLEFVHPVTGEQLPRKHFCIFNINKNIEVLPYGMSLQSGDPFDSLGNIGKVVSLVAELVV